MTDFVIARYGGEDWQLVKWDGSSETVIGTGWDHRPDLLECLTALMDHHGTGSSPFSSRQGAIDAHVLSHNWPLPTRDMMIEDETMPWDDE